MAQRINPAHRPTMTVAEVDKLVKRITDGDGNGQVTFMSRTRGPVKFIGYKDRDGNRVTFAERRGQGGRVSPATVFFSDGRTPVGAIEFRERNFTTTKRNKDLIKALLCHPECAGSPNGGGLVTFELHDPEGKATAEKAMRGLTLKARNIANSLKGLEQMLVCAHFRIQDRDAEIRGIKLDDEAERNTEAFIAAFTEKVGTKGSVWELAEQYRFGALAAVATNPAMGIIVKPSETEPYQFEGMMLGSTYQSLVETLSKDAGVTDRVYQAIKDKK